MTRDPVTILGAGLMGRLLACGLAERGHPVVVHDAAGPDATQSAARVAAAMLAPLAESAITELGVVRMGRHALDRWPQLLAALPQPVYFQQAGTLVLWHRQDAPEAERFAALIDRTARAEPSLAPAQRLDGRQLAELEPSLAQRFPQALYLPGEGQLDNRALLQALFGRMAALGVRMHWHDARTPAEVDPGGGWLLDCRGLGARHDWRALRGVRGEVARVHAPDVTLLRPTRLMHPRYPIYIAPKPGGLFVIGATEIETDDLSPASVRSTLELLSAAYTVHPGFGEARIVEVATQARPTLPDNLPAVRRVAPRHLQVNGLYRHGYLIAPAMLDVTLELIEHGHSALAPRFDLRIEDLEPDRRDA